MSDTGNLKQTALFAAHRELGAKMVPFAGYEMPVQYPDGILTEHNFTRSSASIFDVGHMGQAKIVGLDASSEMEKLVPGDIQGLSPGQMRYTQLTNEAGGIIDDFMVTRRDDHLFLVVNAGRKVIDFAHIRANLSGDASLEILDDRALIALQGPNAARALSAHAADAATLPFMTMAEVSVGGIAALVSRSGYTGEDGYEISVSNDDAGALVEMLLEDTRVKPAGLGARDSLRLEAGLCLYGNDIDETTTPVEAALTWSIGKRRRAEGGFIGAETILKQIADGVTRRRVGIRPDGKAPARAHTIVQSPDGTAVGEITSGGFSPTIEAPVAMGYIETSFAKSDTPVQLVIRDKVHGAHIRAMPFVKHNYFKT